METLLALKREAADAESPPGMGRGTMGGGNNVDDDAPSPADELL